MTDTRYQYWCHFFSGRIGPDWRHRFRLSLELDLQFYVWENWEVEKTTEILFWGF
jgi:hypothetical protein